MQHFTHIKKEWESDYIEHTKDIILELVSVIAIDY